MPVVQVERGPEEAAAVGTEHFHGEALPLGRQQADPAVHLGGPQSGGIVRDLDAVEHPQVGEPPEGAVRVVLVEARQRTQQHLVRERADPEGRPAPVVQHGKARLPQRVRGHIGTRPGTHVQQYILHVVHPPLGRALQPALGGGEGPLQPHHHVHLVVTRGRVGIEDHHVPREVQVAQAPQVAGDAGALGLQHVTVETVARSQK